MITVYYWQVSHLFTRPFRPWLLTTTNYSSHPLTSSPPSVSHLFSSDLVPPTSHLIPPTSSLPPRTSHLTSPSPTNPLPRPIRPCSPVCRRRRAVCWHTPRPRTWADRPDTPVRPSSGSDERSEASSACHSYPPCRGCRGCLTVQSINHSINQLCKRPITEKKAKQRSKNHFQQIYVKNQTALERSKLIVYN